MFNFKQGKSEGYGWLIVVIIAVALLLPQSPFRIPFYFAPLPMPESTYSWQGLSWRYNPIWSGDAGRGTISGNGFVPSTLADGSLSLKYSCEVKECYQGLFTSNSDLGQFSEITFTTVDTSQSDALGDNTNAVLSYSVSFDKYVFDAIGTEAHCDGGGCTPMTIATAKAGVTRFIKEDGGWAVYSKGQRLYFTNNLNPKIEFNFRGNNNINGGKSFGEAIITATFKSSSPSCLVGETKLADGTCKASCKAGEVELLDGSCKVLIQTCIDNNLNNVCDPNEPVIFADPDTNAPVCSDRDANRVCDDVQSLFCQDSNGNKICDADEIKWYATHCEDTNSNGVCDGIESGTVLCNTTYVPVCDPLTNISFPNSCFASGFGITNTISGACKVPPIIIRLDCASGDVPIPSGYLCQPETGFLYRIDKIYINTTLDCRSQPLIEGYTCQQIGDVWVFTKTEVKDIDCYSKGCPNQYLCQAGLCIQSSQRCPTEIDCEAKYGSNSVCDEEIGLCVKQQYFGQDCTILGCPSDSSCTDVNSTSVCVKTVTKTIEKTIFGTGKPSAAVWVTLGIIAAGIAFLSLKKK